MPTSKFTPGGCHCAGTCSLLASDGVTEVPLPAANLTLTFVPYGSPGNATQSLTLAYTPGSGWDTGWVQLSTSYTCSYYRFRIDCSAGNAVLSYAWSQTASGTLKSGNADSTCSGSLFAVIDWVAVGSGPFRSSAVPSYSPMPTPSPSATINQ